MRISIKDNSNILLSRDTTPSSLRRHINSTRQDNSLCNTELHNRATPNRAIRHRECTKIVGEVVEGEQDAVRSESAAEMME